MQCANGQTKPQNCKVASGPTLSAFGLFCHLLTSRLQSACCSCFNVRGQAQPNCHICFESNACAQSCLTCVTMYTLVSSLLGHTAPPWKFHLHNPIWPVSVSTLTLEPCCGYVCMCVAPQTRLHLSFGCGLSCEGEAGGGGCLPHG